MARTIFGLYAEFYFLISGVRLGEVCDFVIARHLRISMPFFRYKKKNPLNCFSGLCELKASHCGIRRLGVGRTAPSCLQSEDQCFSLPEPAGIGRVNLVAVRADGV